MSIISPESAPSPSESDAGHAHLPQATSVAIIMDGNGRWARAHNVSVTEGHRAGGKALRRTVEAAINLAVSELTVFAFSTENWSRDPEEIAGIITLLDELLESEVPDLHEQGVRVSFIGRRAQLPEDLVRKMEWAEALTGSNTVMRLVIAFNYGGRAEIVDAARTVVERYGADALTEESISSHLYDADLREPDMIVRTAGEQRTSNFLVWQGAYSEFIFSDVLWPDFGHGELRDALAAFGSRERRYGGRS